MTNGGFSLTGGFWALFAVQTPDAPLLSIQRLSANSVLLSWPSPSTGFVLEQNSNLSSTNWTHVPEAVSDNGATRSVTVNSIAGNRWYRLFKQ
jgi:hypothetical protein